MKTAIILAAYGSTDGEARAEMDLVEERVRTRFPGIPVRRVYTSPFVRDRMARTGPRPPSPKEALDGLAREGFVAVAVQALHLVAGHDFRNLARSLKKGDPDLRPALGRPLLDTEEDIRRAARALLGGLPSERTKEEAAVFMGHGTDHPAGAAYAELALALVRLDINAFAGCLAKDPDRPLAIDSIRDGILKRGLKTAWLTPLTALAGYHAKADLAGDKPESWNSVLRAAGIEPRPLIQGLCRNVGVVEIWMDHLETALVRL